MSTIILGTTLTGITPPDTHRKLRNATYASVITAALLIVVKLGAWLLTGSLSILASLIDSLMDSIASVINMLAVRYSLTPADVEHRYGHGKAEPLAGLIQAGFICGSAFFLVFHAVDRFRYATPLRDIEVGIGVMVFATVATGALLAYQHHVIKITQSTAIRADALHYRTDLFTNLSIIIALLLARYGWNQADALFAIGIAGYIFYCAIGIGRDAFHQLMDRELEEEVQKQILEVAVGHPKARGVHDLRTRQSGQNKFIQLHLELDADLRLTEAHDIADEVEEAIAKLIPGAEVIVHQDPVSLVEVEPEF
ncbi:MAG: ferrous-iron efflux pump FieF [Halieaceae bacterium]